MLRILILYNNNVEKLLIGNEMKILITNIFFFHLKWIRWFLLIHIKIISNGIKSRKIEYVKNLDIA